MYLFRLFTLLIVLPFIGTAQTERNSCLTFKDLKVECDTWKEGSTAITAFSRGETDSVVFRENDQLIGGFIAKGIQIISPCIVIRDQQGKIRSIDSLRVISPNSYSYEYFGYLALSAVKWEYGPGGILSRMSLKDQKGADSLVREWYPTGTLKNEELKGVFSQKLHYYKNGVLESVEKDTVINRWHVKRIRNYSERGIIRKESWLKDGLPCATEFIYDTKGVLSKTIKHASLSNPNVAPPEALAMEELVMFVSERAEFPGGQTQFSRYLESKLAHELCRNHPSRSTYVLRFEIQEDGTCVYKSLQGPEAPALEPFFKNALDSSPRWKPAKRQGRVSKETFSLSVTIK